METEVLDRPAAPVTARPKTVADVLETAALVIEEHGWIQGSNGDEARGFCAYGAIYYAFGGWAGYPITGFLSAVIGTGDIVSFNDTPGRQAWEVTAALRQAAKRARSSAE